MKVFISWSGERSRQVADALRVWLPRVMQAVRPWMSETDIAAGTRWLTEVSSELDKTSIGIICVTQENLTSSWLHFEAGALSKALDQSRICPMGLNLKPGQIAGPLSQFQAVTLDKSGMLKVLNTLNKLMVDQTIQDTELSEIFDVWWPKLDEQLGKIPETQNPAPARTTEDQLEELLQISREHLRREDLRLEASKLKDEKFDDMIRLVERSTSAIEPMKKFIGRSQSIMNSAKDLLRDIDGGELDPKAAMALVGMLGSQLASSQAPELDTSTLKEMTEFLRRMHEENKSLTNNLLIEPDDTAPPPVA